MTNPEKDSHFIFGANWKMLYVYALFMIKKNLMQSIIVRSCMKMLKLVFKMALVVDNMFVCSCFEEERLEVVKDLFCCEGDRMLL